MLKKGEIQTFTICESVCLCVMLQNNMNRRAGSIRAAVILTEQIKVKLF